MALQRLAKSQGRATSELLQLYVLESFIRRMSKSSHSEQLVLKGGMLMAAFDLRRTTRDIDLLGLRVENRPERVKEIVEEIASIDGEDGVSIPLDTIVTSTIREADAYQGIRVELDGRLSTARVKFNVDLNVGDPVVPAPIRTVMPGLLAGQSVELLAYPIAMVFAEKLVTALQRGHANTRWRDFADLCFLLHREELATDVVDALRAVARHRSIQLQRVGEALEGMPRLVQSRWAAWHARQGMDARVPLNFAEVVARIDSSTFRWIHAAMLAPVVPRK